VALDRTLSYRRMDWFVLACVALLAVYGVLFVGSAQGAETARASKQLMWVGIGVVAFLATIYVDYLWLLRRANLLYGIGLVLLVAVLFTRPVNNARSWFDLGPFKAQPSEFVKLLWVLAMARGLGTREIHKRLSGLWLPLALTLTPVALILRQPDLGTAMIFIPTLFALLYAAGARTKHLAWGMGAGVASAGILWAVLMRAYQKRRILAWLDPAAYAATDAYQQNMARIAIGSGGLTGQGLGKGTLNKLDYVPVKDTDLIFSVVAEEWGFLGCAALLLVLGLLVVSCLGIARRAREPQGRLVVVGVTSLLGFQSIVNLWVAVGLLPTTGVTLPFVSYGGSSLLSSFLGIGLIVNVGLRRHATFAPDPFAT
jgi:rod shape determining protein RodA